MAIWHRTRRGDLALRVSGSGCCALAWLAIARLVALHPTASSAGVLAYGLASVGFLGGCAGCAMVMVGAHLFDGIPVSARWRSRRTVGTRRGEGA